MMIITGEVLAAEFKSGTNVEDGSKWGFTQIHVLTGVEVVKCRLGDNYGNPPQAGQKDFAAEVEVYAGKGRNGAYLATRLVRPVRVKVEAASPVHAAS